MSILYHIVISILYITIFKRSICQDQWTDTNRKTTVQWKTQVLINHRSNNTVQRSRTSKQVYGGDPRAGPVGRRGSSPRIASLRYRGERLEAWSRNKRRFRAGTGIQNTKGEGTGRN